NRTGMNALRREGGRFAPRSRLERLLFRIHEGLVNGGAALVFDHGHVWSPEALDHSDKDDVVGGIDPKPGTGGAIPGERALSVGKIGEWGIVCDGAVVTVPETRAHDVNADAESSSEQVRRKVVGAHELNGRGGEEADAV